MICKRCAGTKIIYDPDMINDIPCPNCHPMSQTGFEITARLVETSRQKSLDGNTRDEYIMATYRADNGNRIELICSGAIMNEAPEIITANKYGNIVTINIKANGRKKRGRS